MRHDSSLRRPRQHCCSFVCLRFRARGLAHRNFPAGGFTLLEILVVLAIVGLLATLTIVHIDNVYERAKVMTADVFARQTAKSALGTYRFQLSDYPSTTEGLQALSVAPSGKEGRWHGPYIEGKLPLDPWGEPYQYACPGRHNKTGYDIWSKGPDKIDGTADDIGNWDDATTVAVASP